VRSVRRLLPASETFLLASRSKLPDTMGDQLAATVLAKGLTGRKCCSGASLMWLGERLFSSTPPRGGVGRLLCQWAAHLGATVIGTVGSEAKSLIARKAGCHHTILYRATDFVAPVLKITGGRGGRHSLRLGRQGHVLWIARSAREAWPSGQLRTIFGSSRTAAGQPPRGEVQHAVSPNPISLPRRGRTDYRRWASPCSTPSLKEILSAQSGRAFPAR